MTCSRCRQGGKTWTGSVCAFGYDGLFRKDNWNCATMSVLLHARPDAVTASGDYSMLVLPFPDHCSTGDECETHVLFYWYKNRGKTSLALVVEAPGAPRLLKLDEAERLADYYDIRPKGRS